MSARAASLVARGAEQQLDAAQLLAIERRAPERVLLAAAEQMPRDHDERACGRDGRELAAASLGDALVKGAQRAGGAGRLPARLDEQAADLGGALLADPPVLRLAARLADPRIQSEVGDQLPWRAKAPDVADRDQQRDRRDHADAGDR